MVTLVKTANKYSGTSKETPQMNIMAYYPKKDYYVGNQSRLPEVIITGKKKKPYWVSASTKLLQPSELMAPFSLVGEAINKVPVVGPAFNEYVVPVLSLGNWVAGSGNPYKGAEIRANDERQLGGWLPLDFIGPKIVTSTANKFKSAYNKAYNNGTLWDAQTTFKGRFGNYGNNLFTNIYGTVTRNLGLPDKARIPADAIRKIKGDININDGIVDFTGNKKYFSNPHMNVTLDRGVVSHKYGGWDGANTYIMPLESFLNQTKGYLKSIEPSDVFSNGVKVTELPEKVTLISGDVESLAKARKAGMQTLSSPKLRRLYEKEKTKYLEEKALAAGDITYKDIPLKSKQFWPEYAAEVQRLLSRRGTPTIADFRLLEEQTGLKAGVAPITEYNNAIKYLNYLKLLNDTRNLKITDINNGKILPYIYPNGREVEWHQIDKELSNLNKMKYNKVFYDPATYAEQNWLYGNKE